MTQTGSTERMKRKELTKLSYLAQEILDNPGGFEDAVQSVETSDTNGGLSDEFREVLNELRSFWTALGDTSDWRQIAERAVALDRQGATSQNRPKRLVGISLAWAAENKLWRIETSGGALSETDAHTLGVLRESAAAATGL